MRVPTTWLLGPLLAVVAGVCCLDVEPVHGRARVTSAATDAGSPRACDSCLERETARGRSCAPKLAACTNEPSCAALLQCLKQDACFETHGVEAQNLCALPCALALGVTSPNEDRVQLLRELTQCAAVACPEACY